MNQQEAEDFYARMKEQDENKKTPVSYGLNSTLRKENGQIKEHVWKADGLYGNAIRHIVYWLRKALEVAENDAQKSYIQRLISYYESGDLTEFNKYCIEWVREHDSSVDFINGFIDGSFDRLGFEHG